MESPLRMQPTMVQWVEVVQTRAVVLTSVSCFLPSGLLYGVRLVPEPSASIFKLVAATWHMFLGAVSRLVCLGVVTWQF